MKKHFHIIVDVHDKQLQKDIVQIVSTMCLDSLFVNFNTSPNRGPFCVIPCDLLIFSIAPESVITARDYKDKNKDLYPDASFIHMGEKFYFYDKSEILEIPQHKFIKYLTRCLLNQYLEFNKRKITEELKQIRNWKINR